MTTSELAPAILRRSRLNRENQHLRIDSHQHFWRYSPAEYGWIDEAKSAIRRDFLPADLERQIAAAGIHGAISVQARQDLDETRWLLELAGRHDFLKGVVGWAPLIDPQVAETLNELASNLKLLGIRHVLQDEPDPDYMLRDDFNAGIRALKPLQLVYDILIYERHLPQTIQFVDRHPSQTFVLDHLAKPRVKAAEISPWRENLQELAKRPNVYCKISGLATEGDYASWTEEQLRMYINVTLEAFGPGRIMFGSDWPVCLLAIDYRDWIAILDRAISGLSEWERNRIWAGTATEAYRLT